MTMTPGLRNFALTAHITSSVGFLGAVAGFLVLAVAGLTSQDAQMVRAAYLTMELTGWLVIVPLCLASLLTGLVQSLGTTWGLFRHYWVLAKLAINVFATIVLLAYMQSLSYLAGLAAETTSFSADLSGLRSPSAVVHAGAALLLLLVATTLSVYKPRGKTRYGQLHTDSSDDTGDGAGVGPGSGSTTSTPRWVYVFGIIGLVLVLLLVIMMLSGGHGPGRHTP